MCKSLQFNNKVPKLRVYDKNKKCAENICMCDKSNQIKRKTQEKYILNFIWSNRMTKHFKT